MTGRTPERAMPEGPEEAGRTTEANSYPRSTALAAIVISWAIAAAAIATLEPVVTAYEGAPGGLVVRLMLILAASALLAWLSPRDSHAEFALAAGVAWLALAVAVEIATTAVTGHAWHELLSDPGIAWMRNLSMIFWAAGPSLFAN